jgi:hypothetical protein
LARSEQLVFGETPDREKAQRREHLRMPATDRMAAGGHVGGGAVTLTTVDAPNSSARPTRIDVPAAWWSESPDIQAESDGPPEPRHHTPVGWPQSDGVEHRLYWGDLHRHSNVSRCGKRRSPPAVVNLGATIEGIADAVVTVQACGIHEQFRLGDLTDDARVWNDSDGLLELHLRRGTGRLVGLGITQWEGELSPDLLRPGSWYYVRVIQVDGEAAWSSPVWVDA